MEIQIRDIILLNDPYQGTGHKKTNITIEGNHITGIGQSAQIPSPEYTIEGKNLIALPPAINGHTHLPMTLLRGYSDNKVLYEWLQDIWVIEGKFTAEWIRLGTELACLEAIKAGTGGAMDMYFQEDVIGSIVANAGLRGWLGSALLSSAYVDQGGIDHV